VFAYICLYNFEINTNASRARKFGVHRDRAQIRRRLPDRATLARHPATLTPPR
jgi:hypothetical protein